LYLVNTKLNITVGFGFCLGRAYSLTMLFNLNTRRTGRSTDASTRGGVASSASFRDGNEVGQGAIGLASRNGAGGISVHQTAVVHIDSDDGKDYYEPVGIIF
jgi:hypothetical protein